MGCSDKQRLVRVSALAGHEQALPRECTEGLLLNPAPEGYWKPLAHGQAFRESIQLLLTPRIVAFPMS